jgi:hypothetical protein
MGVPTPVLSTALNSRGDEDFYQFDRRKDTKVGAAAASAKGRVT